MDSWQVVLLFCVITFVYADAYAQSSANVISEIANVNTSNKNFDIANFLSKKAGAKVISCSSDTIGFECHNVIDDHAGHNKVWRALLSKDKAPEIVIELPEARVLTTFVINTGFLHEQEFVGITARRISIYISTVSPVDGYELLAQEFISRGKTEQVISVETKKARWIKIILDNNWGHPRYTEIGRIYAYNDVMYNEYEMILQAEGKLDVPDIHFETNSHVLMKKSLPTIEAIAELLHENKHWNLLVEGHTDQTGSYEYNMELSRKRAETVVELLIKAGISRSRLKFVGYGSSRPITEDGSEQGMSLNRRVTFRLIE
ncbi:MAG: OmpA family protein [Cytophagales bacterium]|nr:OmpA family protein [Cytophagales bacterium]MDW8384995.1 OmpA family protein [Flammeovirgaceae bacterium]